jgi:succinate dehydrogenase / fumarate reductase, membrane anchor subunit
MTDKTFKETSRLGAVAWLLQRVTAVILFVMLLVHFVTYHFLSSGHAITYEQIMSKIRHWALWFSVVQFLFLSTALYHGLNGLWAVLEDYIHHRIARQVLFGLLWTTGLVLLFIGTSTILRLPALALK